MNLTMNKLNGSIKEVYGSGWFLLKTSPFVYIMRFIGYTMIHGDLL